MHRDFGLTRKKQLSFLDNYLIFRALSVIRMRLERMTVCLEGRCSIQLSYRTILGFAMQRYAFFATCATGV